jgi:hypothetical protein
VPRLGIARQLLGLAHGRVHRELAARHLLMTALLEVGDVDASDAEAARLADAAARHRDTDFGLLAVWWRAMRALLSGDLSGAEAVAAELHDRLAGAGGAAAAIATLSLATIANIVAWERGRLGESAAALAARGFVDHPGMQAVRALAHAEHGDGDAATAVLTAAFGPDLGRLGTGAAAVSPLVLAAEALARAGGGRTMARALLERLTPYADAVVVFAPGAVCMGAGTLYTGTAAALAGDLDRARRDLEDAVRRNRALGADPFTVRSLVRLAAVLAASGDAHAAAQHLREAAAVAGRRGLPVPAFALDGATPAS